MHETSIIDSLIEQVGTFAPPGAEVEVVRIDVGQLEHLDDEIMRLAWKAMTPDTPCAGAVLEIDRIPVHVRCQACSHEYQPEDEAMLVCPECASAQPEILQGAGVLLRSLEVETTVEQT